MLRRIKYFQAVVRCHSFTEAAAECFVSQSAISQQVRSLEKELGVSLLSRENRHFSLTPAGEYFYTQSLSLTQASGLVAAVSLIFIMKENKP